jgi:hypothetical protein
MKNNKQQTAVEWLSNLAYELFEQYSEGRFDRITLNKLMLEATDKAKEIEKEQHKSTYLAQMNRNNFNFEHYFSKTYEGGEQ